MFIRLTKKPNNRVSIRIVENNRVEGKVKQRTISGIGTAHEDDLKKIETLKRVGEDLIIKLKNEADPVLPGLEKIIHAPQKKMKKVIETEIVSVS